MAEEQTAYTEQSAYTGGGNKQFWVALGLCILGIFGLAGIHRLYTGKVGSGICYLLTSGWFGIGTVYDIVQIVCGNYRCKDGSPLYK